MEFIHATRVRLEDEAWLARVALMRDAVLPYQWEILNDRAPGAQKSHCVENFKILAGEAHGERQGVVFLDSDLYKWLEAVAYLLAAGPAPALERAAQSAVALLQKAQAADGYLNTWYQLKEPEKRFANLMEGHEMYCAGHLIEAAVAWKACTGREELLGVALRAADCLYAQFGPGGREGYPGHPEIELALMRLWQATGEAKYRELALRFLDRRGDGEDLFEAERRGAGFQYIFAEMRAFGPDYFLAHLPVRAQRTATGHAVRAVYLFSAMADAALSGGDPAMERACQALWEDVTQRQMYVTGGIGSSAFGERFTADFDLPGERAYAESCASVGLMGWARRMWLLTGDASCCHVWERALNNTVLAALGADGKHYFYVNPLESVPRLVRADPALSHVKTQRQAWFGVACCPPNIARCVLSLPGAIYAVDAGRLCVLSHIASRFEADGLRGRLSREGDDYTLTLEGPARQVVLYAPENTRLEGEGLTVADGWARARHPGGVSRVRYRLLPQTEALRADPRVAALTGRVCVQRGHTVYCAEEADNGPDLCALRIPRGARALPEGAGPDAALTLRGFRVLPGDALYTGAPQRLEPVGIRLIPYRNWGRRGEGEMRVWLGEGGPDTPREETGRDVE